MQSVVVFTVEPLVQCSDCGAEVMVLVNEVIVEDGVCDGVMEGDPVCWGSSGSAETAMASPRRATQDFDNILSAVVVKVRKKVV